jgi:hypothetical protein
MNTIRQIVIHGFAIVVLTTLIPPFGYAESKLELELGAAAGVPIGNPFAPDPILCCGVTSHFVHQEIEHTSYAAGPFIAIHPFHRIRVSFGAVYMPVGFTTTSTTCCPLSFPSQATHGAAWEFPLLGDYEFLRGPIRPFAGGGLVLGTTLSGGQSQPGAPIVNGGVEWRYGRMSVRPEYRIAFYSTPSQSNGFKIIRDSGQQFLVGFSFRITD